MALAGGRGKKTANNILNNATMIQRSPGSSIKPLSVYGPALEYGLISYATVLDDTPVNFACSLSHLFGKDFTFLKNYVPDETQPSRTFPVFVSQIRQYGELKLAIMANKMQIPSDEQAIKHLLLGFSMFDENYYLFNDSENPIFECPYGGYDYIMLLSCNKTCDISDIVDSISGMNGVSLQDISHYLNNGEKSSTIEEQSRFVRSIFVNISISMREMNHQWLCEKLRQVITIPTENYLYGCRYSSPVLTSSWMEREDI